VKICTPGRSAFTGARRRRWDVLLLDLKLPDGGRGRHPRPRPQGRTPSCRPSSSPASPTCSRRSETMRPGFRLTSPSPRTYEELGMRVEKGARRRSSSGRTAACASRSRGTSPPTSSPARPCSRRCCARSRWWRGRARRLLIEGERAGSGRELARPARAPPLPAGGKGFVDLTARRVPSSLLRKRALRLRARGLHRRRQREAGSRRGWRTGGTLFLDEVGEMIPEIQSKFLRVLDSGTFLPASGRRASVGPTSGSSAPRTATSRARSRRDASARISSSASTALRW